MRELDTRPHWRRWLKRLALMTGSCFLVLWMLLSYISRPAHFQAPYYQINLETLYSGYEDNPVRAELMHCRYGGNRHQFACRYRVEWRHQWLRGGCYIRTGHAMHCWVVIPESINQNQWQMVE